MVPLRASCAARSWNCSGFRKPPVASSSNSSPRRRLATLATPLGSTVTATATAASHSRVRMIKTGRREGPPDPCSRVTRKEEEGKQFSVVEAEGSRCTAEPRPARGQGMLSKPATFRSISTQLSSGQLRSAHLVTGLLCFFLGRLTVRLILKIPNLFFWQL